MSCGCGCGNCVRSGLGDATDLGSIINPSWLAPLQPPISIGTPLAPLTMVAPPNPNPFVTDYTIDSSGNAVLSSIGTDMGNINPFDLSAGSPNWTVIAALASVASLAVVLLLPHKGARGR